jgi:hypothetical protein
VQDDPNQDGQEAMARTGIVPNIPIPEDEALTALLRVKPSSDMPRPGASARKKSVWAEVNEETRGSVQKKKSRKIRER